MSGTSIRNENLSKPLFSSGLPAEELSLLDRARQIYSNLTFNPDASFNPAGACIQTVAETAAQAASETVRALFMGKVEIDGAAAASAYRRWSGVSNNRVLSTATGLLGELLSVNFSILDSFLVKPTRNSIEGLVYGTAGMLNQRAPVENQWESTAAVLGVLSSLLMVASGVRVSNPASGSVWMRTEVARAEIQSHRMFALPSVQGLKGLLPARMGESVGTALVRPSAPAPRLPVELSRAQLDFARGGAARHTPAMGGGGVFLAPAGKRSGAGLSGSSSQSQIAKHIADLENKKLSSEQRMIAADALDKAGDPTAGPTLIKILENKSELDRVRAAAAYALRGTGNRNVLGPLIKALRDESPVVRAAAATALGKYGKQYPKRVLPALIKALKDEKPEVRAAVANALGEIEQEIAVDSLIETLQDEIPDVRLSAARALGKIRSPKAVFDLIQTVERDNDSLVKEYAVYALGAIQNQQATLTLGKVLKSDLTRDNIYLQIAVVVALGQIGGDNAVLTLLNVKGVPKDLVDEDLADEDDLKLRLREFVDQALNKIASDY